MKGLMVFSHHMEDIEALGTRALLTRAGLNLQTITFEDTLDIKTSYGLTVKADDFGFNIDIEPYDFIVIPGGRYVSEVVNKDVNIKALLKKFNDQNKLIAAICLNQHFFQ